MSIVIASSDGRKAADIGSTSVLYSLYSTIIMRIPDAVQIAGLAVKFLHSGFCASEDCLATARQTNLLRDRLSQIPPEEAVYDMNDLDARAPWEGNISPVITSCGNFYTTSDGKDLIFEIVSVLTYAGIMGCDAVIQ
ncbi:MAG: hypothetical protein IKF14_02900 [Atopobiaceae bacterium]|nr:hypothetical protein [Atopobiaceae bacterium]